MMMSLKIVSLWVCYLGVARVWFLSLKVGTYGRYLAWNKYIIYIYIIYIGEAGKTQRVPSDN